MSRPTYSAAVREAERLRGDLVEETPGRASREELARWADDPVGWDLEAGRDPTDYQQAVMESVAVNKRTAWRGCHAAGKEFVCGSLAIWAAYARRSLVLVVSATERQAVHQTMKEVRKAWRAARKAHGIGGELYQGSVRIGGEDRVVALTGSANVDALTGWHDHENGVVVLISEGQGERLEAAAYDAAEGNVTTERGRILAAGNPVRPSGRFYEIHQRSSWERFRTSAFDTPNVKAGEVVRPGFPAPDWPQDVAREYGEDSPFYRGRVLAEFPTESDEQAIPTEAIEAAFERFGRLPTKQGTDFVLGVDPSGPGADRTAVTVWRGMHALEYHTWTRLEAPESADRILELAEKLRSGSGRHFSGSNVGDIYVDEIGVGHGLVGILKRRVRDIRWKGTRVHGVNISKKPGRPERFVRRKCELIWHLREDLVEGRVALAENEMLREELRELRVRPTPDGKIEAERKQQMKARLGGRSPDLLDSLLLATNGRVPDGKKKVRFR